jgi:hypothetical protein
VRFGLEQGLFLLREKALKNETATVLSMCTDPSKPSYAHHTLTLQGAEGQRVYILNRKALSTRCTTLEETLAHLKRGHGNGPHPDIRIRCAVVLECLVHGCKKNLSKTASVVAVLFATHVRTAYALFTRVPLFVSGPCFTDPPRWFPSTSNAPRYLITTLYTPCSCPATGSLLSKLTAGRQIQYACNSDSGFAFMTTFFERPR